MPQQPNGAEVADSWNDERVFPYQSQLLALREQRAETLRTTPYCNDVLRIVTPLRLAGTYGGVVESDHSGRGRRCTTSSNARLCLYFASRCLRPDAERSRRMEFRSGRKWYEFRWHRQEAQ